MKSDSSSERIRLALTALFCVMLLAPSSSFAAEQIRYIIKLRSGADLGSALNLSTALPEPGRAHRPIGMTGVTLVRPLAAKSVPPKRTSHYRGPSKSPVKNPLELTLIAIADSASANPALIAQSLGPNNIEYIEVDPALTLFALPIDDLFPKQWHLLNDGQEYTGITRVDGQQNDYPEEISGVANEDIGLRSHFSEGYPLRKRPLIGVIDTGVDDLHPELQGNIWSNPDEIPSNGIDDDHNGYVDDTWGWDFSGDELRISDFLEDNAPTDQVGHGSHIAGIIASSVDGEGVVGVCPHADIMSLKIFPNAFGSVGAAAVIYAVNNGVDILNISWGTPFRSQFLDEAFEYAVANGVFVAVASGNSGDNQRTQPGDITELFTVGATNSSGFVTYFSSYGANIDLVAPGRDILSIRGRNTDMYADAGEPYIRIVNTDYYLSDGTSMAAPMVAAAAGFLLSVRPELQSDEISQLLLLGARDIVQPYDTGAAYPGPDSLSGSGFLDIDRSLALITGSALALIEPRNYTRMTGDFAISVVPVAGYSGGWDLGYGIGQSPESFTTLETGFSVPVDSVVFFYTEELPGGLITLRLRDDFGVETFSRVYVSRASRTEITSPVDGDTLRAIIDITGFAHANDFDSLRLTISNLALGGEEVVYSTTAESYGTLIYAMELGVRETGEYRLVLENYSQSGLTADSVVLAVISALHTGWPVALGDFSAISPVAADLDGDGSKELLVGSRSGLQAFHMDGRAVDGFPVSAHRDCRSVSAIYDVDNDGFKDIIYTSDSGLHVVNRAGEALAGWPKMETTGQVFLGFPTPRVLTMTAETGEALLYMNSRGQLRAFYPDGTPYFYSLGGLFTRIDPNLTNDFQFLGLSIPQIASFDYDLNGTSEIMAAYSSPGAVSGLFIFNGRDGQPVNWRPSAEALRVSISHGMALGDVDSDGYVDALISGVNEAGNVTLWLRRNGEVDFAGWPIELPSVNDWIGGYPILSDIDGDNIPEAIAVYTEFDISKVFVFKLSGEPFRSDPGRDFGELLRIDESLSSISIADIDGDGSVDLVSRSGFVFPGSGFERLHAFTIEGGEVPGFPLITTAHPSSVTSFGFVPLIDDLDNDGLVEIALAGSGGLVHVWDMPGAWNPGSWDWPRFMRDNNNSARNEDPLKLMIGSRKSRVGQK